MVFRILMNAELFNVALAGGCIWPGRTSSSRLSLLPTRRHQLRLTCTQRIGVNGPSSERPCVRLAGDLLNGGTAERRVMLFHPNLLVAQKRLYCLPFGFIEWSAEQVLIAPDIQAADQSRNRLVLLTRHGLFLPSDTSVAHLQTRGCLQGDHTLRMRRRYIEARFGLYFFDLILGHQLPDLMFDSRR